MFRSPVLLWLVFCFSSVIHAQKPIDTLIATEKAFAATSARHSTRKAFLAYLHPHSIGYNEKGFSYNLYEDWTRREEDSSKLTWQPHWALLSTAGDIGITMGPWEYRPTRHQPDPIAQGYFSTVWQRSRDSAWKAIVDLGISCPGKVNMDNPSIVIPDLKNYRNRNKKNDQKVEYKWIRRFHRQGLRALSREMDEEGWLNINGFDPFQGKKAISAGISNLPGDLIFFPATGIIAVSRDLLVVTGAAESKTRGRHGYLRVWKQNKAGDWKIILMVLH